MGMLLLARAFGAGASGMGAVPFLLGLFVANGVIAGRAVGALVGCSWSVGAWLVGVPVAAAASILPGVVWNNTPGGSALLVRLFGVTAAVAVVWALRASRTVRRGSG